MFRNRYFKTKKIPLLHERELDPVPILNAGAIWAEGLYEGRVLPVFGLDVADRPDLDGLISIHQGGPPGDIEAAWGKSADEDLVHLHIRFIRPAALNIFLEFSLGIHGLIVDHMIYARAFYIQRGSRTDPISSKPEAERIVIGLPEVGFRPHWRKMFEKYIRSLYRKNGLSRHESKQASTAYLKAWDKAKQAPDTLNEFLDRHS